MRNAVLTAQALQTASVMGWFTLDELCAAISLPQNDTQRRDQVWRALAPVATEHIGQGGAYCWQIAPDARRAALSDFYALPQLDRFMEHAPRAFKGSDISPLDRFGLALHQLLRRERMSFGDPGARASADTLREAMKQAAAILDAVQFAMAVPALDGVVYDVRHGKDDAFATMDLPALKDFAEAKIKELQGRCDIRVVMPKKHFGYSTERRAISKFVRGESEQVMPILLTGVGGAGKSALLSRLLTGWRRTDSDLIPVLLDFDRRQLNFGEPVEILQEMLRQIIAVLGLRGEVSDSPLRAGLRAMRDDLALHKTSTSGARETNLQQASDVRSVLRQFNLDWAAPLRAQKIVLILDTFEAVDRMAGYFRQVAHDRGEQPAENEVVSQIMDLLSYLQGDALPGLRVIVSGREEPLSEDQLDQWFGLRLRLRGLSTVSGAKLLRALVEGLGQPTEAIFENTKKVRRISKLLDGHPLALIAFARYVDKNPTDVDGLIKELETEGGFKAEFAQVFLYERILDRIADDAVRPLAHPGLILRQLDWQVIRHVLAEPCLERGPDTANPMTDADAQELFKRLRNQYWLVETVDETRETVRHVPDLRRLMLAGLLAGPRKADTGETRRRKEDLKRRALAVCAAASAYFAGMEDAAHELDAVYYAAFNNPVPDDLPPEVSKRLELHLGDDVSTLPIAWRAQIKHHLGADLSPIERDALPEQQRLESVDQAYSMAQQTGFGRKVGKSADDPFLMPEPANRTPKPAPPVRETQSLSQLAQDVEIGWANATPQVLDDALLFLERLFNAPDLAAEPPRFTNNLLETPLTHPIYTAVLISATGHTPRTPQIAAGAGTSAAPSSPLRSLLLCAQGADEMRVDQVHDGLRSYLQFFAESNAVAANRFGAQKLFSVLNDDLDSKSDMVFLDYPGMSLAAGHVEGSALRRGALKGKPKTGLFAGFHHPVLFPLWDGWDQEDLTQSSTERLYRKAQQVAANTKDIKALDENQRRHLRKIARGLNPELYAPTAAILAGLPSADGERVVVNLLQGVALWPRDLMFDDKLIYDGAEAPTIVEAADRCGVLRELLDALVPHNPFAERLVSIYDFITSVFFERPNDI